MPNMTIKDIARLSGCSVSTISRVINDRPDVRPETKEKVLQMMRESGFVPNTSARQLKIQQSRSLVFVVKGTRNLFFSDFLVQLQRAATLYGYSGIVSYLDENANEIDAAQKILREIKPKGMIFLGGSVANFQQGFANITVPAVLTNAGLRRAGISRTSRWWAWMTGLRPAPPSPTSSRRVIGRSQFSAVRPPVTPVGCAALAHRMPWRMPGSPLTTGSTACPTTISKSAYHAMNSPSWPAGPSLPPCSP
mgnify:CR=1 FL=1